MSVYDTEDIAKWEDKQMTKGLFQVEEVEILNFDENGKETLRCMRIMSHHNLHPLFYYRKVIGK